MSRHRWAALILMATGLLSVGASLAGLAAARGRPAVEVTHADPHAQTSVPPGRAAGPQDQVHPTSAPQPNDIGNQLAKISGYGANRSVSERPSQPHTGLWIEIPSLRISLPIREGDGRGETASEWVALHLAGTADPGAAGNSYIYAHGLWGMFGALLYARQRDEVDLRNYDSGQIRKLHVSRVVGRIHWNDTHWMHYRAERPTLTLQTCVDDNQHGDRFIVQAS
jgi:LPXTG-site transpeptidase (sortase) family protein